MLLILILTKPFQQRKIKKYYKSKDLHCAHCFTLSCLETFMSLQTFIDVMCYMNSICCLDKLLRKITYRFKADDTQLYLPVNPKNAGSLILVTNCFEEVKLRSLITFSSSKWNSLSVECLKCTCKPSNNNSKKNNTLPPLYYPFPDL